MDFSSQPQNVKIEIAWLGECWNVLKSRIGEYIAMGLIILVTSYVISFIIQLPLQIVFGLAQPRNGAEALGMLGANLFVNIIAQFVTNAITFVLSSGVIIFTLKLLRNDAARFEDLFSGFKSFGVIIIAGLIYSVCTTLGMFACLIGSVFVAGLLMFMVPLIYDRNLSAVEAAKESVEMLKSQWGMAGGYMFVSYLFGMAGFLACCVGIIATFPIIFIAQAVAYHKFVGMPDVGAEMSTSGYPRDPSDAANMPAAPAAWPTQDPTPAPSEPDSTRVEDVAPSVESAPETSEPEPPAMPEPPSNMNSDATGV